MRTLAGLVVILILAAGMTSAGIFDRDVQAVCGPDVDGGLGVTISSATYKAGQAVHGLSTDPPGADRTADVVIGTQAQLGLWWAGLTAGMRGEVKPPSVSRYEARAVSVHQAALLACSAPCPTVTATPVDATQAATVSGYSAEQLGNAAAIVNAGAALGLSPRDQTIGVMTALGESGLRVLDRGDRVGPDSRGLFQQRDNGAWGSYADRMDPTVSATSFFRVLATVEGREGMTPTAVAHRVQRNADPDHYTRYWPAAQAVVASVGVAMPVSPAASVGCAQDAPGVQPAGVVVPGQRTVAELLEFAAWAQAQGAQMGSNRAFGRPPSPPPAHSADGWHYKHDDSGAIDITTRPGVSVEEQRELAPIALEAQRRGFGVIFMRERPDHDGHVHVDVGGRVEMGDLSGLLAATGTTA